MTAQSTLDWLERQADRAIARQRAQVDTSKLLVIFTTGIAATLVATALQVGEGATTLDRVAAALLLMTFFLALVVIALDRLREPDPNSADQTVDLARQLGLEPAALHAYASLTAEQFNSRWIVLIWRAVAVQILFSGVSGAVATLSLLK